MDAGKAGGPRNRPVPTPKTGSGSGIEGAGGKKRSASLGEGSVKRTESPQAQSSKGIEGREATQGKRGIIEKVMAFLDKMIFKLEGKYVETQMQIAVGDFNLQCRDILAPLEATTDAVKADKLEAALNELEGKLEDLGVKDFSQTNVYQDFTDQIAELRGEDIGLRFD